MIQLVEIVEKFPEIEKILNLKVKHLGNGAYQMTHPLANWKLTFFTKENSILMEDIPPLKAENFSVDYEKVQMDNLFDAVYRIRGDGIMLENSLSHLRLFRSGAVEFIPRPYSTITIVQSITYEIINKKRSD